MRNEVRDGVVQIQNECARCGADTSKTQWNWIDRNEGGVLVRFCPNCRPPSQTLIKRPKEDSFYVGPV